MELGGACMRNECHLNRLNWHTLAWAISTSAPLGVLPSASTAGVASQATTGMAAAAALASEACLAVWQGEPSETWQAWQLKLATAIATSEAHKGTQIVRAAPSDCCRCLAAPELADIHAVVLLQQAKDCDLTQPGQFFS